jgi:hypothetical protein
MVGGIGLDKNCNQGSLRPGGRDGLDVVNTTLGVLMCILRLDVVVLRTAFGRILGLESLPRGKTRLG